MAVEIGALALAIRDQGGDTVLKKVQQIDQQAAQTGKRGLRLPVSAPGADKVVGSIGGIGKAANGAAAGVARLKGALGTLGGVAGGLGVIGGVAGFAVLATAMQDAFAATDEFERAQRRLSSTARITGASLADLTALADEGKRNFQLSAGTAADFAAEITRLTSAAGRLDQSSNAMRAFLDLGAARGLSTADTLQAVRQAVLGIDEGTDRLFGRNPGSLWKDYADKIGTTAGKLTDMQKQEALLDAALRDGAKARGSFADWLNSSAGRAELLAKKMDELKVALGQMFAGTRDGVLGGGATFIGWIAKGIKGLNDLDAAGERWWRRQAERVGLVTPESEKPFANFRPFGPSAPRAPIVVTADPVKPARVTSARMGPSPESVMAGQVRALDRINDAGALTGADLATAIALQERLNAELAKGNLSLERRADILGQLETLGGLIPQIDPAEIRTMLGTPGVTGPATTIDLPVELRPKVTVPDEALQAAYETVQSRFQSLGTDLAGVLGGAIAAGFSGGDVGSVILQGLGNIMMQLGQALMTYGLTMMGLLPALLNPFTSGPAALAAGAALMALGAAMGAAVMGRKGGGSSGRGMGGGTSGLAPMRETISDALIRRATLPPGARPAGTAAMAMPTGPQISVIGVNTPQGQRLIGESAAQFTRRGGRG